MALTSPDDIWTPDATDDYSLTVDLATMADTIQDALVSLRAGDTGWVTITPSTGWTANTPIRLRRQGNTVRVSPFELSRTSNLAITANQGVPVAALSGVFLPQTNNHIFGTGSAAINSNYGSSRFFAHATTGLFFQAVGFGGTLQSGGGSANNITSGGGMYIGA